MAKLYGSLVGQGYNPANSAAKPVGFGLEKATNHVLIRDTIELAAAAINDTIFMGKYPSNTILDPDACKVWFDDLGTSVTLDIGDVNDPDGLVAAQDVATAAGSASAMKTVDIANYFKPLWAQLGYAKDPGGLIELYATIKGAAATGTLSWQLKGSPR